MNIVGFLTVLINFHVVFASQSDSGKITNLSIETGSVRKLASVVRSLSDYDLDGFRSDGFYRVKDEGKYLSTDLLNYMRYGNVNPREEGVIVTAHYSDRLPPLASQDKTVGYLIHSEEIDSEFKRGIIEYLRRLHRNMSQSRK